MEIKGIDLSSYNPVTSYSAIADSGIKAAILRISQSQNELILLLKKIIKVCAITA